MNIKKPIIIFALLLLSFSTYNFINPSKVFAQYDSCNQPSEACCGSYCHDEYGLDLACDMNINNPTCYSLSESTPPPDAPPPDLPPPPDIPEPKTDPWCGDNVSGILNVKNGVNTAFGCIILFDANIVDGEGADMSLFLSWILKWAIGLGGGIAFLLIIWAGFMIMTSSGNPERLKAGQELLTSAIMGLIMLIFSIFILGIIGVDILAIPGFGT